MFGPGGSSTKPSVPASAVKSPDPLVGAGFAQARPQSSISTFTGRKNASAGFTVTGAAVFALPGNPVSTLVCLTRYVVPALFAAMGQARTAVEKIALSAPVAVGTALAFFMPVKVEIDDWGRAWAAPSPTNGSGDFTSLGGTDGFVELPPGPNTYAKGFVTRLYRW